MELRLTESDVTRIRDLLMVAAGGPDEERWTRTLQAVGRLVPCDLIGICVADATGCVEYDVSLPVLEPIDPQVCDGPLDVGIHHLSRRYYGDDDLAWVRAFGFQDCVRVGVPLGGGRVVQLWLDRTTRLFDSRDVAVLTALEPALTRLMVPTGAVERLDGLTAAERRVLDLVARGASNRDVADVLCVSEGTVRKHLEHAYRKLGVTNRTAASALVLVDQTG